MKLFHTRTKYRFNPETCDFKPVRRSVKGWLGTAMAFVLFSAGLSALMLNQFKTRGFDPEARYYAEVQEQISCRFKQYSVGLASLENDINRIHKNDQGFYRSILNKKSIDPQVWEGGVGGSVRSGSPRFASPTLQEMARRRDRLFYKLNLQKVAFEETMRLAKVKSEELKHVPAIVPIAGRTTSGFGYRCNPFHGHGGHFHAGVDISAQYGTPIVSAADGVVITAGTPEWGYGLQVEIDHGYGFVTKYAHMSNTKVHIGQKVKRNQIIGLCGSSGYSTGPHLHYDIIRNDAKINPEDYYYTAR